MTAEPFVRRRRTTDDRGSVLMLMPACVLVVLVLAALAVDLSLVQLRQRQAVDAAASAADDAVTAGAAVPELRTGNYAVSREAAAAVVHASLTAGSIDEHLVTAPEVAVEGNTVQVTLTLQVDHLFSGAIPGAPRSSTVTATASATAYEL